MFNRANLPIIISAGLAAVALIGIVSVLALTPSSIINVDCNDFRRDIMNTTDRAGHAFLTIRKLQPTVINTDPLSYDTISKHPALQEMVAKTDLCVKRAIEINKKATGHLKMEGTYVLSLPASEISDMVNDQDLHFKKEVPNPPSDEYPKEGYFAWIKIDGRGAYFIMIHVY